MGGHSLAARGFTGAVFLKIRIGVFSTLPILSPSLCGVHHYLHVSAGASPSRTEFSDAVCSQREERVVEGSQLCLPWPRSAIFLLSSVQGNL